MPHTHAYVFIRKRLPFACVCLSFYLLKFFENASFLRRSVALRTDPNGGFSSGDREGVTVLLLPPAWWEILTVDDKRNSEVCGNNKKRSIIDGWEQDGKRQKNWFYWWMVKSSLVFCSSAWQTLTKKNETKANDSKRDSLLNAKAAKFD